MLQRKASAQAKPSVPRKILFVFARALADNECRTDEKKAVYE